jgi:hypothetical protein
MLTFEYPQYFVNAGQQVIRDSHDAASSEERRSLDDALLCVGVHQLQLPF